MDCYYGYADIHMYDVDADGATGVCDDADCRNTGDHSHCDNTTYDDPVGGSCGERACYDDGSDDGCDCGDTCVVYMQLLSLLRCCVCGYHGCGCWCCYSVLC